MSNVNEDDQSTSINIPVDWHIPEDFPSPYASNMFAQAGEIEEIPYSEGRESIKYPQYEKNVTI